MMMTTAEEDPRVCSDCAFYRPLSHLVEKVDGYCAHPLTYRGVPEGEEGLPLFVRDGSAACRYRVPRRPSGEGLG